MRKRHLGLAAGLLMWAVTLVPANETFRPQAAAQSAPGRILAPANRQLAWLDLDAPRPRLLTRFDPPAYVTDVTATPTAATPVIAVTRPLGDGGPLGGDLLTLDVISGRSATLAARADPNESLSAPAWWFDGRALLFERQDWSVAGTGYAGTATVLHPTRIDMVQPDGSGRTVLVEDGRQPAPAPDGSALAFLQTSSEGTALVVRTFPDAADRVLIMAGPFRDLASPRYSPRGDRLAFMAPGTFVGNQAPIGPMGAWFGVAVAAAHGLPWDVWMIGADGSGLRRLAEPGADDATLSWSPDGSQLFVYGGLGSFIVDAATGEATPLPSVAGYGSTAWLPDGRARAVENEPA